MKFQEHIKSLYHNRQYDLIKAVKVYGEIKKMVWKTFEGDFFCTLQSGELYACDEYGSYRGNNMPSYVVDNAKYDHFQIIDKFCKELLIWDDFEDC